jgi:hypothetical protein
MDGVDVVDKVDIAPQASLFGVHIVHHFEKRLKS